MHKRAWCKDYHRKKWTQRAVFNSCTRLSVFHFLLMWLEFEPAYYDFTALQINHYATWTSSDIKKQMFWWHYFV